MNSPSASPFPAAKSVALWLWMVCTLIVIMVAVGGITRLTESGLSMVNWDPLLGWIPPGSDAEWNEVFDQYKATPQYDKFSAQGEMTLGHFKDIYFWEYVHRVLGRVIGLAYGLPFAYFMIRHRIPAVWKAKLSVGLLLGGAQGVLGWYMVKSGLVDRPYVSHFRLAAHLSLALLVFSYLLWMVLDLQPFWTHRRTNYNSIKALKAWSWVFLALLSLQIVFGAFTAGLRAGYMYNSYPLMGGIFFPADGVSARFGGFFENLLHNPALVQFTHRHLGLLVLVSAFVLWRHALKKHLMVRQKFAYNLILILVTIQFLLGVFTLVGGMNMALAVAHQVCACLLLGAVVTALHEVMEPNTVASRRS